MHCSTHIIYMDSHSSQDNQSVFQPIVISLLFPLMMPSIYLDDTQTSMPLKCSLKTGYDSV